MAAGSSVCAVTDVSARSSSAFRTGMCGTTTVTLACDRDGVQRDARPDVFAESQW
jgi:hypothetical protein